IPVTELSKDPIICAIFGGGICGLGVGLALKGGLSSGGLDIISVTIRKMTGKNIGSLNIIINACIILTSAFLFGWPYAFYSAFSIFVNGKVVDVVFTKQKKMEIMIITTKPDLVIEQVQKKIRRGITILNNAEG
ncbi:YitT family protein, partial [Acinetobacter baumannii]|nr:YitT family protein [Acinetobacter baumannii]